MSTTLRAAATANLKTNIQKFLTKDKSKLPAEYRKLKDNGPAARIFNYDDWEHFQHFRDLDNYSRNRYTDVVCYDVTRVKLDIRDPTLDETLEAMNEPIINNETETESNSNVINSNCIPEEEIPVGTDEKQNKESVLIQTGLKTQIMTCDATAIENSNTDKVDVSATSKTTTAAAATTATESAPKRPKNQPPSLNPNPNPPQNPKNAAFSNYLSQLPTTDYIHANYVSGFNSHNVFDKKCYIAAQGPLQETAGHFWEMIVQEKIFSIVMTTRKIEKMRPKCYDYWPTEVGATVVFDGQDGYLNNKNDKITVTCEEIKLKGMEAGNPFGVSVLKVERVNSELQKQGKKGKFDSVFYVNHCWFTAWPDHGVPENFSVMTDFVTEVRKVDQEVLVGLGWTFKNKISKIKFCQTHLSLSLNQNSPLTQNYDSAHHPVLVHCSAGIGRTGTYIVIDQCMHQFDLQLQQIQKIDQQNTTKETETESESTDPMKPIIDNANQIDEDFVYSTGLQVRKQRAMAIQTGVQYEFCHNSMVEYIKNSVYKDLYL